MAYLRNSVSIFRILDNITTDIEPLAEDFAAATRLPDIIPFPDVETRIFRLQLNGDYKIKENMTARFRYMYENMETDDFSLDGVDVDTLSNIILLGNQSPQYDAHVFGLSLIYRY